MYSVLLFLILIVCLFFLSIRIQRVLGFLLLKLTGNYKVSVYLTSIILLPGTFVHEMAHFLMALILLVPARDLTLLPVITEDSIRLGSVKVAKTDIFRSFLISSAPVIFGISIVLALAYIMTENTLSSNTAWLDYFFGYLIFAISNSMFMSRKDLNGIWGFLIFFSALLVAGLLLGLNFNILGNITEEFTEVIDTANLFLSIPLVLDLIVYVIINFTAGLKWR